MYKNSIVKTSLGKKKKKKRRNQDERAVIYILCFLFKYNRELCTKRSIDAIYIIIINVRSVEYVCILFKNFSCGK